MNILDLYTAALKIATSAPTERQIALVSSLKERDELTAERSAAAGEMPAGFALGTCGNHEDWCSNTVRATAPHTRRHVAALGMGYTCWEEVPADQKAAATAARLWVPALAWVAEACAIYKLRTGTPFDGVQVVASRRCIEDLAGRHVRLNHPHEGAAFGIVFDTETV